MTTATAVAAAIRDALILNVDDTEAARYAKTRILQRAGFRVIEAATGNEAIRRAEQDKPDLVLLDIKLPDINGFEVCRRLKAQPSTQPILVLQTSASYIASADKIRALEGGADNYLFEPIEPEELVANVKALLRLGKVEQQLREADRRKDIFLATLAHELRNPLAPILTAAELLGMLDPGDAEPRERARQTILRHTHYMIRLVDDLLDVSRITSGKIVLRQERVVIQGVINAARETAAASIAEYGHSLSVTLPEAEICVQGDSVRLAQIVANLLTNAAKFTQPGGQIHLSVEAPGDHVLIRVEDNGIGISKEKAATIFELFTQAEVVKNRERDGLGIGLALVKGLTELHGGTVSMSSEGEGRGSKFEISLPICKSESAQQMAAHPAARQAGAPRRVLLVDDNVDGAVTMAALLEQAGHEVMQCHSGKEGLDCAKTYQPDVVILDIGLPDISGFEVARQLRADPRMASVLLVALTGYGQHDDKKRAHAAGFDVHLTKPISFQTLLSTIA